MRQKTAALLDTCKAVLSEYEEPITIRHLYYRLVGRQVIENSLRSYKNLIDAYLTPWRKAGLLDPAVFCDLTRKPTIPSAWEDLSGFFPDVLRSYRRDPWQGQDRRPEVWLEKDALVTVFEPICRDYAVTLQTCRGYASVSSLVAAAERTKHILFFGDFDGSGENIAESVEGELRDTWGANIGLVRIALTPEQIAEHNLPGAIPKPTDSRTKRFLVKHGEGVGAVELDALRPDALRVLLLEAIEGEITDPDAWREQVDQEAEDREELAARLG